MAVPAALLVVLHLGFEQVRWSVAESLSRGSFDVADNLPVLTVVSLDDLKGPAVADDVATDQTFLDLISKLSLAGIPQVGHCLLQREIGCSGKSMKLIQGPAGLFNDLKCERLPSAATISSDTPAGRRELPRAPTP